MFPSYTIRKALLVVLCSVKVLAQLNLTITPTVTIGQTVEATWVWDAPVASFSHTLVMVYGQGDSKTTIQTVQSGESGVISLALNPSATGAFQATLTRMDSFFLFFKFFPATAAATFVAALPTTPPTSSPLTTQVITTAIGPPTTLPSPISSPQTTTTTHAITTTIGTLATSTMPHRPPSALLAGSIVGGLVAFLLLALSAICIWRRCRVRRMMKAPVFYPAVTIPGESSVAKSYWAGDSDLSSLTPSDSVSKAMHSFPRKVRPLLPSTAMTSVSEESKSGP